MELSPLTYLPIGASVNVFFFFSPAMFFLFFGSQGQVSRLKFLAKELSQIRHLTERRLAVAKTS